MKTLLITLLLTVTTFAGLPTKLEELQQKRDKAIENINLIYKQELQKLLADPAVKADPVELAKVKSELEDKQSTHHQLIVQIKDNEKYFVGKSWFSLAGVEYKFGKDQAGMRISAGQEIPMSWRLLPDGIVEATSRLSVNGPPKLWFFKFDNKKTALFGETVSQIINPLFSERQ